MSAAAPVTATAPLAVPAPQPVRLRSPAWTYILFAGVGGAAALLSAAALALWYPAHRLSEIVKMVTPVAAVVAAVALPLLIPRVLRLIRAVRLSLERENELERAHTELQALYRKVTELDDLKSNFFTNISHELRTPLALISGPARTLASSPDLTEAQRNQVTIIGRNARLLLRQVNDLLDVARLDSGRMPLRYARMDLAKLLRMTVSCFEAFAQEKRIRVTVEAPEILMCEADAEKVQRIVLNLLSNAFKFTPDEGQLRCVLQPDASGISLSVADTGPGVRPDLREAIFERFEQGEPAASRSFGGTGLGLAIAKEFADLHGGLIVVDDAPGGGAVFRVWLPLSAPAGTPLDERTIPWETAEELSQQAVEALEAHRPSSTESKDFHAAFRSAPTAHTADVSAPRILIVEDNADMRRFLRAELCRSYRVSEAHDGQQGLERVLSERPDLIITDLMMPKLNGEELVARLRAHPELEHTPVLILTAKNNDALRSALLGDGAQDYLIKPFTPEELVARVKNLVKIKRTRDLLGQALEMQSTDLENLAHEIVTRNEALAGAEQRIRLSLKEKDLLLKEIHHRVKNNLQIISSLLSLQSHYIRDTEFLAIFDLSRSRVKSMALVHEKLYQAPDLSRINMADYLESLIAQLKGMHGRDKVTVHMSASPLLLGLDEAVPCALITHELVVNAFKHAFPAGRAGSIEIRFGFREDGRLALVVSDDGVGPPEGFRAQQVESFGLRLVTDLTDQLRGGLQVESNGGARFTVSFNSQTAAHP